MGKQTLQYFSGKSIEMPDRAIIVGCHCATDEKMLMTENFLSKVRQLIFEEIKQGINIL